MMGMNNESDMENCRISLKEAVHCFSLGEQGNLESKESDWRGAAFAEE